MTSKLIDKAEQKYKIDSEFHIAEDESHIIYQGVKYNWFDNYYRRHHFSKSIPCNLQRAVWTEHFGQIPEGHHIHHKDGDTRNNHIENLQCLPKKIHLSRAAKKSRWVGSQGNLDHLKSIQEKAKAWHSSEEGRAWHKAHALKCNFGNGEYSKYNCQQCGKEYFSKLKAKGRTRFCSNSCKTKSRYISGVDNENRQCVICQTYFITNRYKRKKTCCRTCQAKLGAKTLNIAIAIILK